MTGTEPELDMDYHKGQITTIYRTTIYFHIISYKSEWESSNKHQITDHLITITAYYLLPK